MTGDTYHYHHNHAAAATAHHHPFIGRLWLALVFYCASYASAQAKAAIELACHYERTILSWRASFVCSQRKLGSFLSPTRKRRLQRRHSYSLASSIFDCYLSSSRLNWAHCVFVCVCANRAPLKARGRKKSSTSSTQFVVSQMFARF